MNAGIASVGGGDQEKRSIADFYPTPPEVTEALLNLLGADCGLGRRVWEPACGDGDMVRVLEVHGFEVIASDLRTGTDFLTCDPVECDWIITNPPFSKSVEFIRRCHDLGKPFALLLKSQYWHSAKRLDLFHEIPPSIIAPLTWRPDFSTPEQKEKRKAEGKRAAPPMDVIWCVWFGPAIPTYSTSYIPLRKPEVMPNHGA